MNKKAVYAKGFVSCLEASHYLYSKQLLLGNGSRGVENKIRRGLWLIIKIKNKIK